MYTQIDTDRLKKPGAYLLDDISLVSYQSANGSNTPKSVNIKTLVLEMNLYESLQGTGLSGNIVVADGQTIVSTLSYRLRRIG